MIRHLATFPILIPLLFGAILLLLERRNNSTLLRATAGLGLAVLLGAVVLLFEQVRDGTIVVYLLGDWPARLGVSLVVDRLSALMLLTTTLLAIPCLLYACAGWDKRAMHFHVLFQLQLAGLNGAFLTGDIFNLFVFFEVMLIASYGLLLSGGRGERIRAGMHYVTFNIVASTLFLIALGLLYGLVGTLNMAEIGLRLSQAPPQDVAMIKAAFGLLIVVFCAKAALLPMYLWLPEAYSQAPAAVAALFTIMTKVGLYSLLRISSLWFGEDAGPLAGFAREPLLIAGLITAALAALGVIGSVRLRIGVAYLVLWSAGTLFIAFSLATPRTISAGLYYLPHSAFVTAALFLLADVIQRQRRTGDQLLPIDSMPEKTLPALLFLVAAVTVAGLPPLSGFIGKVLLLAAVPDAWVAAVYAIVLATSLIVVIALSRAGTRLFWRVSSVEEGAEISPPPKHIEIGSIAILLAYGIAMTVAANPILRYTGATSEQLLNPANYIQQVRGTTPQIREPSP